MFTCRGPRILCRWRTLKAMSCFCCRRVRTTRASDSAAPRPRSRGRDAVARVVRLRHERRECPPRQLAYRDLARGLVAIRIGRHERYLFHRERRHPCQGHQCRLPRGADRSRGSDDLDEPASRPRRRPRGAGWRAATGSATPASPSSTADSRYTQVGDQAPGFGSVDLTAMSPVLHPGTFIGGPLMQSMFLSIRNCRPTTSSTRGSASLTAAGTSPSSSTTRPRRTGVPGPRPGAGHAGPGRLPDEISRGALASARVPTSGTRGALRQTEVTKQGRSPVRSPGLT